MAVTGSFQQACPSCEAKVLVKDPKQIGKKVDCPNCKYRFVVEEPAAPKEEETADAAPAQAKPKPKASQAVTAKKPAAPPPAPAAKKKTGPRKPVDEDDEDDEEGFAPKGKEKSSNLVLILGVGLSIFAVALLGIGGYFIFFAGKDDAGNAKRNSASNRNTVVKTTQIQDKTPDGIPLVEVTSLLPNDTQGVVNLNVKDVIAGSVGRAAFDTPGAFKVKYFEDKFGLKLKEIDRVVLAQYFRTDSLFAIVRTSLPLRVEEFKKAVNLETPADSPYKEQEYFLTPPIDWFDRLALIASSGVPSGTPLELPQPRKLAVRIVDPQTLVVADEASLKAFLDVKGQPKQLSKPPAANKPGTSRYLTVSPELKGLLDQLEGKTASLLVMAWEMGPIKERVTQQLAMQKQLGAVNEKALALLDGLSGMGIAVQLKDNTGITLALDGKSADPARSLSQLVKSQTDLIAQTGALARAPVQIEVDGRVITNPPPGVPVVPPPKDAPPLPKVTIKTTVQERTFLVNAELSMNQESSSLAIQRALAPAMLRLRGMMDMTGAQPRIHDLAAAALAMSEKLGKFPRGTFNRPITTKRFGRPYPPDERVSWMAELLPYLDQGETRRKINTDKSWRDPENAERGAVLVPAFLDPRYPAFSWWVEMPSMPGHPYAMTHFVGMAGVGPDAAEYAADDPSAAAKLGIFGYDRETKFDDVKDGRANTILMIQMPPSYKRPWLAGGGATVVGVPEKDSIKPFVCMKYGDKNGTYAIMADGAVRFIPETISDKAFQALCTINGNEKVDLDKETVLIPPPGRAELKTQP